MIYLQTTQKARTTLGIGREDLGSAGVTPSVLGNWLLNVVPMRERTALLFMSGQTLLSFPVLIGEHTPTPQDMPSFLAHGVTQLLQFMRQDPGDIAKLIPDFDEICICKATDKSLQTVFSAVATDYVHQLQQRGGKATDNLGEIIGRVNSMPRATLAWKTSFEASLAQLHPGEVRPPLD
jgi:hypothetical protein